MKDETLPPLAPASPGIPAVRALERGIALMRAFSAVKPRLTLTELSKITQLDKGTTRRLLHTLKAIGMVDHDDTTGQYSLSVGVMEIASGVETGRDLREIAAQYLSDVVARTGATTFLWVLHEGMALCIERTRSTQIKIDTPWFRVGTRASLNCGGGPRVLLAHATPEERAEALRQPLSKRTTFSVTDPAKLWQAADEIRERGYEFATDDFALGLSGIGVPILDGMGHPIGAISVSGLTRPLQEELESHVTFMQNVARTVGRKFI